MQGQEFLQVSVIIPVYQTEAYLRECIESVLMQDYKNLEIILVDDGSPDGCPELCDWYAGKYSRIRVIHQENQGAGVARNTGVRNAEGDFVLFLDSDDILSRIDSVRILAETALRENADVVTGNFRRFQGKKYGPVNRHHLRNRNYTKTVDFRFRGFLTEGHLIMDWGKLYRKDFLLKNQLWCKWHIRMEDKLRNMMCCVCEPVYAFVEECVYLYRITESSTTRQYQKKAEELKDDWIYVAECFNQFLKERQRLEAFEDLLAFHVFCGIFTIGRQPLGAGRGKGKEAAAILKRYGENYLVQRMVRSLARGKYLGGIHSIAWRILIWGASALFCMRQYRLLVFGIFLLQGLGTERKESRLQEVRMYLGKSVSNKEA